MSNPMPAGGQTANPAPAPETDPSANITTCPHCGKEIKIDKADEEISEPAAPDMRSKMQDAVQSKLGGY